MREPEKNLRSFLIDKSWTLFLDRDGVINKKIENGYVKKIEEFEILPGVIDALRILRSIFGRLIIVTNQRGIARGFMAEEDLFLIHKHMLNIFEKHSIFIDRIYFCPHDEKDNCNCRKPKTGMIQQAMKDFNDIDLKKCIMVGDSHTDILTAKNMNIISVFIGGNSKNSNIEADFYFDSLFEFALAIRPCSICSF